MMKYTLLMVAFVMGVVCAQEEVTILRSENENKGDGTFSWLSELSDGTKIEQSGYIKDGPDPDAPIQVIQGSYFYISPEGEEIDIKYVADENGYVPEGKNLPTPPPIPADIQKSLDIIAGTQPAASNHYQQRRPAPRPPTRSFSSPRRH